MKEYTKQHAAEAVLKKSKLGVGLDHSYEKDDTIWEDFIIDNDSGSFNYKHSEKTAPSEDLKILTEKAVNQNVENKRDLTVSSTSFPSSHFSFENNNFMTMNKLVSNVFVQWEADFVVLGNTVLK